MCAPCARPSSSSIHPAGRRRMQQVQGFSIEKEMLGDASAENEAGWPPRGIYSFNTDTIRICPSLPCPAARGSSTSVSFAGARTATATATHPTRRQPFLSPGPKTRMHGAGRPPAWGPWSASEVARECVCGGGRRGSEWTDGHWSGAGQGKGKAMRSASCCMHHLG